MRRWCWPPMPARRSNLWPKLSPAPKRNRGGFPSARPATAASIKSFSNGWRSIPARDFSIFLTRAARPRPQRSPAGIFRSASWQARQLLRTVKSGRVRVLAVTMAHRSKLDPQWPTLQQEGVQEVDASNWTALFAPKGTPQAIIDRLNVEVVKVLNAPDVKERFAGGGVETIPSSAAELDARVKREAERFRAIVQKANIRPD